MPIASQTVLQQTNYEINLDKMHVKQSPAFSQPTSELMKTSGHRYNQQSHHKNAQKINPNKREKRRKQIPRRENYHMSIHHIVAPWGELKDPKPPRGRADVLTLTKPP